ncbi:winged helix-turn-helix transcriptional regulator [Methanocorpusculum sp. MG]|uniref:Winged helix-turn-helix transcriptional regulator n=1 Tax=Methanocorpusculum petauri TaxID=3002863 RepID=A0ABT4IEI4_9EURY|nr:winged helix-turn-helix transcriptional regulator [Methanocorpusculum petauri]MCZ0860150.1 winged helix-turn-helix transcriptional regulator [Methanocorpusculum petauri]
MKKRERYKDLGIIILLLFIVFAPGILLFFADDGQITGINEDPHNPGNALNHDIGGYVFEPVEETITPLYDDTEVVQTELWQMSLRDALLFIGLAPFTYIPPSVSKIISILYLISGLAFLILYAKISEKNRDPDSTREQIYRWICTHPGKSQQQIADSMKISRGSLKYHLNKLLKQKEIHQITSGTYPQYFSSSKKFSDEMGMLLTFVARDKDHQIIQNLFEHPGLSRTQLVADLHLSPATITWRMKRFAKKNLIISHTHGKELIYELTPETIENYQKILTWSEHDPNVPTT